MATTIVLLSVGREWAAVTTEGLLVYSLDNINIFDPFDLEISITPAYDGLSHLFRVESSKSLLKNRKTHQIATEFNSKL